METAKDIIFLGSKIAVDGYCRHEIKTLAPWKESYDRRISSVQSLSCVQLFVTPWTSARQASLSITNSQSLPKFMSINSVTPSNHLILCLPFLLP